jgi:ABC-2 type transport system permease protein
MSPVALAWRQFRFERRMFWRNPSAAFFNFALPLIFLFLIASVFGLNEKDRTILIPGIAGMSVMTTTFTALAFNVTFLREQGILKRIRGTPLPPVSYFGGLIANAVTNAVVQVALVIAIGKVVYSVPLPHDWLELVVFTLLGVVAFSSLGIAMAQAIPNFDSAAAYVNAVFLPMIFISGTFYESKHLPAVIDAGARILPLRHVIDGLRGAIVRGGGLTHHVEGLVVLAAWSAAGIFLALRYFRWE